MVARLDAADSALYTTSSHPRSDVVDPIDRVVATTPGVAVDSGVDGVRKAVVTAMHCERISSTDRKLAATGTRLPGRRRDVVGMAVIVVVVVVRDSSKRQQQLSRNRQNFLSQENVGN